MSSKIRNLNNTFTCSSTVAILTTAFAITASTMDISPLPSRNHRLRPNVRQSYNLSTVFGSSICAAFSNTASVDNIEPLLNDTTSLAYEEDFVLQLPPKQTYSLKAHIVKTTKPAPSIYHEEAYGFSA